MDKVERAQYNTIIYLLIKKRKEDNQMFVRDLNFSPVSQASKESLPLYIRELLDCIQPTTSKLESLYKEKMRIKILASPNSGNVYRREIVMLGGRKRIPRELAYIEIFLESLSVEARKEVKEGKTPFGRILEGQGVETTRKIERVFRVRKTGQMLEYSNSSGRYCYGKE